MTRSERELLLERHLTGQMTPAEEEEFYIKVALDRQLRTELQAHRAIDGAIVKEIAAEPGRHSALRERAMALLIASPSPSPVAAPASTAGNGVWVAIATVVIGLVVTAIVLTNRSGVDAVVPAGSLPRDIHSILIDAASPTPVVTRSSGIVPDQEVLKNDRGGTPAASPRADVARRAGRPVGEATRAGANRSEPRQEARPLSVEESREDSVPVRVRIRFGVERKP